jgi:branched-chain amino acid transport system substrate-binding protein
VYVVTDRKPYGDNMAGVFIQEFLSKGGSIQATDDLAFGGAEQMASAAARIAASKPQAVFFGGNSESGQFKVDLVQAGYTGPFVVTDGVYGDPTYLSQAGQAAIGTFATNPASELEAFTSQEAAAFIHDYQDRYPGQSLDHNGGYAANAYDAAMILITAIKRLVNSRQDVTRAAVIEQVQHIQYTGITGPISFDTSGDNAHAVLSLYTVKDGAWVFMRHIRV